MSRHPLEWHCDPDEIACTVSGVAVFRDRRDHWQQGVLRLLGLTDAAGRAWVEDVAARSIETRGKLLHECSPEEKLALLVERSARHFPGAALCLEPAAAGMQHLTALDHSVDCQWVSQIRDCADLAVAGNQELRHGILLKKDATGWAPAREARYEESYFEGNLPGVGYGRYSEQAGWRMEKALTLVRRIRGIASSLGLDLNQGTRLLDVGSGYGFFRKAAEAGGWRTQGLEVSRHAIQVAKAEFGIDTFAGTLDDFARCRPDPFEVITLFDTIEHVTDPLSLVRTVSELLAPRGVCVIRTPNLGALELRVFGGWYHSFKAEHLHYFSPESLTWALERGGLVPVFLTSDSHLLSGFFGPSLQRYARLLAGSDLFAVGQRQA
ncbi:MAG TPA: class I SAM-dependent methyltransferase [Bryobacteraceae bacterium]|nr:class I SAM-dependent methyltransferase [Bryobacteraceae bacterium]